MHAELSSEVPTRIGPFRVVDLLGKGGMGVVYRAFDERTNERVAIKTVTIKREFDLVGLRREIHGLQRLDHPGVVRIVDSGVEAGVPWYAMPLLRGETLASFSRGLREARRLESSMRPTVRGGSDDATAEVPSALGAARALEHLPQAAFGRLQDVLTIARRLCSTLAFLHGEGIVHRDLTPANVFLVEGEDPQLLDFGLFRRFAGSEGREEIEDPRGHAAGTLGYMAPEQRRGELVDARADLYALGCILHELLTGRLPESSRTLGPQTVPPLPPSLFARDVPKAIDDMVLRLLASRPEDRFGHATELIPILAAHGARAAEWEHRFVPRDYLYRPRMVGRATSLARIDDRLGEALDRRGSVVLIAGESGIGKTYLATHALRAAAASAVEVIVATCLPRTGHDGVSDAALHPFRALLQEVADRCLADSDLAPKLLGDRGRVLATIEPRIASLPWVRNEPPLPSLPAEAAQRRLFLALADTLEAFASRWPCVLVLDDLQWADELTLRFLAALPNDWFDWKGLLVLATFRAEEESAGIRLIAQRPWATRIDLGRLSDDEIRALVCDMLGLSEPPPVLVTALARASAGNPFFVAEHLRTAISEGMLARDAFGQWSVDARLLEAPALPRAARLESIVGKRLDALSPAARALLAAIVVLGKEAEAELAFALASSTSDDALEATRELIAKQVVEERDGVLYVLHDILRETAYSRLPLEARRALHRRAVDLLEARPGSEDVAAGTIARHAVAAGDARRAVRYLALAGERALSTFANRDAIAVFRQAVALSDEASVEALRRARWHRRLAEASHAVGDLDAAEQHLATALALLDEPAPRGAGWVWAMLREIPTQFVHRVAHTRAVRDRDTRERHAEMAMALDRLAERAYYGLDALTMVGASLRAVNRAERAGIKLARPYAMLAMTVGLSKLDRLARRYFDLSREAAANDDVGLAFAQIAESAWHIGEGDFERARQLAVAAIETTTRSRSPRDHGLAETLVGHVQYYRGEFRESVRTFERLTAVARREENQQYVAWGLYAAARALVPLGEYARARAMLVEADALLAKLHDAPSKLICSGLLALASLRDGDLGEALAAASRCEVHVRESPPTVFSTVDGYVGLAEVRLDALRRAEGTTRVSEARAAVRRALSALERFAFAIPLGRAAAARMRGELHVVEGRRREAIAAFERALDHARARSMPHEEALAHAALARILAGPAREAHRANASRLFSSLSCRIDPETLDGATPLRRA